MSKKADPRLWTNLEPPLPPWMLAYVEAHGFAKMTAVQASVLPQWMAKRGTDLVVEAVTGSGKTLAFLLPVCHRLLTLDEPTKRHHVASIIMAPTRELAVQIHAVLLQLLAFHPASHEQLAYTTDPDLVDEKRPVDPSTPAVVVPQLLVAGAATSPAQDLAHFVRMSPNLLIATPGRLAELLQSPRVHCPQSSFEILIMDEADRLLDLGFKPDIQRILSRLPKQRRTGLFSASISEAVGEIIRVGLRNPVKITVRVKSRITGTEVGPGGGGGEDRKTPASLEMKYIVTPARQKLLYLGKIFAWMTQHNNKTPLRSILFFATCAQVDYFQHIMSSVVIPDTYRLVTLHGKQTPKVRDRNLSRFVGATTPAILMTTDLAARGLDIPQVDFVAQLDPPSDPKVFIHRNGRAGRAGRLGLGLVFLQPGREEEYVSFLEVRQTPTTAYVNPEIEVDESEADTMTQTIRNIALADRSIHDKAQRAFVSWVRSYTQHTASSIFRTEDLPWVELAAGWGLLRLPRMPETKHWDGDWRLSLDIDWDHFAYHDAKQEASRLKALEAEKEAAAAAGEKKKNEKKKNNNEAWSGKIERQEMRTERKEKRKRKVEAVKDSKLTEEEKARKQEIEGLLAKIRERNAAKLKAPADDGFEGFAD